MHSAQLSPDVVRAPANRETANHTQEHAAVSQDVAAALLHKLGQAQAALLLLCDVDAKEANGAMGTLQFAQRILSECAEAVGEMSRPVDDLYWGVFCAHSLIALLEDHCWEDAWQWTLSKDLWGGSLSAARDCVAKALNVLMSEGATQ